MEKKIRRVEFGIPTQPKLTKVAAYARVSSGKDAMLHSLAAQVSYYSDRIQSHPGWLYCGVYSDEAFTGTKENREGFQHLLTDCRAGKIDLILTKSISRFARNTVTLLDTVRELKQLGIDVFFEEQNIHTLSGDGELMMTILASYAQEESLSASENQKWRIRHGFERGELINLRFLYGYDISRDGITVNEAEAVFVREIFERVANGESMSAIARDLNERNIPRPFKGAWSDQIIRQLVANEKYLGNALLQKTYVNNHLEKKQLDNKGELPMYYAEGTHEAIVDEKLFKAANEILARFSEERGGKKVSHDAFTGKLRCGICGTSCKRTMNRSVLNYSCRKYAAGGRKACPSKVVPLTELYRLSAEVLGLTEFDENIFSQKIERIDVYPDNRLIFIFNNGSTAERTWADRSRSNSWTPKMKEAARQRAMQQRRKNQ